MWLSLLCEAVLPSGPKRRGHKLEADFRASQRFADALLEPGHPQYPREFRNLGLGFTIHACKFKFRVWVHGLGLDFWELTV